MKKLIFLSVLIIASPIVAAGRDAKRVTQKAVAKINRLEKGICLKLEIDTAKLHAADAREKGLFLLHINSDEKVNSVIDKLSASLNQRSTSKGKSDYVPENKTVILSCNGSVMSAKKTLAELIVDKTMRVQSQKKKRLSPRFALSAHFFQEEEEKE